MEVKSMSATRNPESSALKRIARDPHSRRKFLALTGGTGVSAALLAACGDDDDEETTPTTTEEQPMEDTGGDPLADFGEGDLGIVNYALTLEYLEAGFYAAVAKSGLFKGDSLALVKTIGDQEQQHVDALTATAKDLGGKPAPEPKANFPLDSAEEVLMLAATVENLGAAAYLGQAAAIQNPDILAAALSIHANEARHAAVLNTLVGEPPTPDGAFAVPADAETVLAEVQPFLA
ncbi:MAG: ferritin-like domain-containing protein [Actinomycetota bacterium]|nr:ferritin-like domain-containing protein [Actinomycetota bacterium]